MRKFCLVPLVVLCIYCTKVFPPPQPAPINLPPGDFDVKLEKITDRNVTVSWGSPTNPEQDPLTYEVAINDSVVAYDINENSYTIDQLTPDQNYELSVIAIDSRLNTKSVSKSFRTLKSFIDQIFSYHMGIDKYGFTTAVSTSDQGFLIYGYTYRTGEERTYVILKLAADFSIEWKQEFGLEGDNNFAFKLMECSDHNFIIVREKTILKIDPEGNTIWSYQSSDNDIMTFTSVLEDSNSNLFVAGYFYTMPGTNRGQYFVIKLASDGTELFKRISSAYTAYGIGQILTDNDKLILYGATNKLLCFVEMDFDGNLLNTYTFPNAYSCSNMPLSLRITQDNNYLMFSSIAGYVSSDGYYDNIPRIVKSTKDGMLLWDKYYKLTSTNSAAFPTFDCVTSLNNGQYLAMISDDSGVSAAYLDQSGTLIRQAKLPGFPSTVYVTGKSNGQNVFLTNSGEIIVCNPDGYTE